MEEDNLPEAESPTSLLDAIDTTATSVKRHITVESAPMEVSVKAGQKHKQKDSNTNQLPRSDMMLASLVIACRNCSCGMLRRLLTTTLQHLCFSHETAPKAC